MYKIGVDVGGMSVKIGLVDDNGNILAKKVIKTVKGIDKQVEFVTEIANVINLLISENKIDKSQVLGVGVGCPGTVDSTTGIVVFADNIKWEQLEVDAIIERVTGLKCFVANDADCATLGEMLYGSCKNDTDIVMLTLGTGVGGGLILNGKLYQGYKGMAAELGHTTLKYKGKKCNCGRRGCFEQYASVTALIDITKKYMLKDKSSTMWEIVDNNIDLVDGKTAFSQSKKGDKTAKKVVNKYVSYLAEGILNYCNIFRPQSIVLGGAISNEGDYLINLIKKIISHAEKQSYGYPQTPKVEIKVASLKNDAGIIGAAALV